MFIAVAVFGLGHHGLCRIHVVRLLPRPMLMLLGAADVVSVVIRHSLVQIETPDAMRGRVSAVNSVFIGTSNQLGEFESGVTAAWFGTKAAVLIGGIGTILIAALWTRALVPALAKVDSLEGLEETHTTVADVHDVQASGCGVWMVLVDVSGFSCYT